MSCGRTAAHCRKAGIFMKLQRYLMDVSAGEHAAVRRKTGVYSASHFTDRFMHEMRNSYDVREVFRTSQLGFELSPDYLQQVSQRVSERTLRVHANLRHVPADDVCDTLFKDTARSQQIFPGAYMPVMREATRFDRHTLHKLASHRFSSCFVSYDNQARLCGVSVRNAYPALLGRCLVLDLFGGSAELVVEHAVCQLEAAVAEEQALHRHGAGNGRLFVSVYFPQRLDFNEVLCGIRNWPELRDMPLSNHPRLSCNLKVGELFY